MTPEELAHYKRVMRLPVVDEPRWYDHVAVQFVLGALSAGAFWAMVAAAHRGDQTLGLFLLHFSVAFFFGAMGGVRDNPLFAMFMFFGTFLAVLTGVVWLLLTALGLVVGT